MSTVLQQHHAAAAPPSTAGAPVAAPTGPGWLAAFAVGYFALAVLGDALSFKPQAFATFWPASGLLLAILAVRPPRSWPPLLAAAIAGNLAFDVLLHGRPATAALGFVTANLCEGCLGAWLLRRLAGPDVTMRRLREPVVLLAAALAATAVSASVGAATVALAFGAPFGAVWRTWWAADVVGALVVAPTILAWRGTPGPAANTFRTIRVLEAGVLAISTLLVGGFVFLRGQDDAASLAASARYLVFPLLLWAAVRFGPRGATLATAVVVLQAVRADTALGGLMSPHGLSVPDRALLLQVFILVAALFAMIPAALREEWRLAHHRLQASLGSLEAEVVERRQAQEQVTRLNEALRHNVQALEVSNRELEAFSYAVSHDLRAPLRSVSGFSQAVLDDYGEKLDARGRQYLAMANEAARDLGQLIDDLLSLSRVSRVDMEVRRVDLSALSRTIVEDLRRAEPERQVEVEIAPDLAADGDSTLLRLLLENLLRNAWKFTSRHATGHVVVGREASTAGDAFLVADDGAGFDMAYIGKLFRPFQRLHRSSEFPGTGIGLATVGRIVLRHGGTFSAHGELEKGATFRIHLPRRGATHV